MSVEAKERNLVEKGGNAAEQSLERDPYNMRLEYLSLRDAAIMMMTNGSALILPPYLESKQRDRTEILGFCVGFWPGREREGGRGVTGLTGFEHERGVFSG